MLRPIIARLLPIILLFASAGAQEVPSSKRVVEGRVYRIGVHSTSKPFSYTDELGRPQGFAPDLLRAIADYGEVAIELKSDWWRVHFEEFDSGAIDGLCGAFPGSGDNERFETTISLIAVPATALTNKKGMQLRVLADLAGLRVGSLSGSASLREIRKRKPPSTTVIAYDSISDAERAIQSGDCDVLITNPFLENSLRAIPGLKVMFLEDFKLDYHFSVRRGETRLISALNEGIARAKYDGTYDRLYAKWIGPVVPRPLTLSQLKPYLYSGTLIGAILLGLLFWQRHYLRQIQRHAKAAEEANVAKTRFLATMSHEIRTPINGIVGMTDLLLTTPLGPEQKEMARITQQCSENLLHLMNDVLDVAQMESGKLLLESVPLDPRQSVETCLTALAVTAFQKNLEIAHDISPDVPPRLLGDPGRISQVLTNLVSNAIKFTDKGAVTVTVRRAPDAGDRIVLRFEVKDTGVGLSREDQSKLFRPFTQVNQTTTRNHGGAGLGLAICRHLVDAMEGRIGIESSPGAGATFWFTLPFSAAPNAPAKPACPDLQGQRILVVEDHPLTLGALQRELAACHASVETAANAADALRICRQARAAGTSFSLALIDLSLSGVSGLDLIQNLRCEPAFAQLPIVLLINLGTVLPEGALTALGISCVVNKPLRREQVIASIERALPLTPATPLPPAARVEERNAVLIVDDSLVNVHVLRRMGERLGLTCAEAFNGRSAVDVFAQGSFRYVLMDVQMPEMDGLEATRRIRSIENKRRTSTPDYQPARIVGVTGDVIASTREGCLAAGMDEFLSKPVQIEALAKALAIPLRVP